MINERFGVSEGMAPEHNRFGFVLYLLEVSDEGDVGVQSLGPLAVLSTAIVGGASRQLLHLRDQAGENGLVDDVEAPLGDHRELVRGLNVINDRTGAVHTNAGEIIIDVLTVSTD